MRFRAMVLLHLFVFHEISINYIRFKTGDIAFRDRNGYFHILGRASVDIIKSGGFKVSALEIEKELLDMPQIIDVAVIGVPSDEWGETIGAIIVMKQVIQAGLCYMYIEA
jgi:acyl-coenzyme A synthetase/AMP-(fatty) acid ligase